MVEGFQCFVINFQKWISYKFSFKYSCCFAVEFVLALTGSVTGSVMFFILPALMYIKTFGTYSPLFTSKAGIPFSSSASSSTSSSVSSSSSHRRLRIHPLIVLVTGVCVLLVGSMIAVEDQQAQGSKAPSIHKTRSTPKPDVIFGANLKVRILKS